MPVALITDVLVIGGGLAGARAAQAAAEAGAKTILVSKARLGIGGASARASGGFAAAVGKEDSAEQHAADTLSGGYDIANARRVEAITQFAPDALRRLNAEVSGFAASGHQVRGQPAPMHTAPRSVQYPHGMAHLMSLLRDRLQRSGVELMERHRVIDLQVGADGRVVGACFCDGATGELQNCLAGAVVLAAGGCGQIFPVTSNGPDATGDGYGLALRAGCALQDMEFIQYTPTAFAAPEALKGHTIVGTLLTVEGVQLLNAKKERFMERYAPVHLEGADRATLARAIFREVSEGRGTPAGGVYLDATMLSPAEFNSHRPGFHDLCMAHGIDPCEVMMETAPAVHTCLGGVRTDDALRAAANLWVAGEALAGMHGANRLSSNSLTEANVTGWLAGKHAAASAPGRARAVAARPHSFALPAPGAIVMSDLRFRLQALMGRAASVERSANGLETGLSQLAALQLEHGRAAATGVDDVEQWLDLRNMLPVARAILGSALQRTESRGAHARSDFPDRCDENWRGNIVSTLAGAEMRFKLEPVS